MTNILNCFENLKNLTLCFRGFLLLTENSSVNHLAIIVYDCQAYVQGQEGCLNTHFEKEDFMMLVILHILRPYLMKQRICRRRLL